MSEDKELQEKDEKLEKPKPQPKPQKQAEPATPKKRGVPVNTVVNIDGTNIKLIARKPIEDMAFLDFLEKTNVTLIDIED